MLPLKKVLISKDDNATSDNLPDNENLLTNYFHQTFSSLQVLFPIKSIYLDFGMLCFS